MMIEATENTERTKNFLRTTLIYANSQALYFSK